jgi:hypothetical protein
MSSERWWWANKAQELRFHQLETVRRQAETWRTGLAGLTALVGATLLVKGRDNLVGLSWPYPMLIAIILGLASAALVAATLRALRAASGMPGDECLLTGEDLEAWTSAEVALAQRGIAVARRLTVGGLCALAAAIGLAWFAPAQRQAMSAVMVDTARERICGELVGISDGAVVVHQADQYRFVPLTATTRVTPTSGCSK